MESLKMECTCFLNQNRKADGDCRMFCSKFCTFCVRNFDLLQIVKELLKKMTKTVPVTIFSTP